jgi:DnaJ-class molecular chaperone
MKYSNKAICPECRGTCYVDDKLCYFCEGTGYAVDEDTEEHWHKYESGW